jgi:hypothetical protein
VGSKITRALGVRDHGHVTGLPIATEGEADGRQECTFKLQAEIALKRTHVCDINLAKIDASGLECVRGVHFGHVFALRKSVWESELCFYDELKIYLTHFAPLI